MAHKHVEGIESIYYPDLTQLQFAQFYQSVTKRQISSGQGVNILESRETSISYLQRMTSNYQSVIGGRSCCCCCCRMGLEQMCAKKIQEDPYGIGQCGQGFRSNMANSPEALLALNDIFKGGERSYDKAAKELKEKYGIFAEVGDIKTVDKDGKEATRKGIRFANGDYFVDSNGDNQLGNGDYKFADAIKNLKETYGVNDDFLKHYVDRMKNQAEIMKLLYPQENGTSHRHHDPHHHAHDDYPQNINFSGDINPFGLQGMQGFQPFGNGSLNIMVLMLFLQAYGMAKY